MRPCLSISCTTLYTAAVSLILTRNSSSSLSEVARRDLVSMHALSASIRLRHVLASFPNQSASCGDAAPNSSFKAFHSVSISLGFRPRVSDLSCKCHSISRATAPRRVKSSYRIASIESDQTSGRPTPPPGPLTKRFDAINVFITILKFVSDPFESSKQKEQGDKCPSLDVSSNFLNRRDEMTVLEPTSNFPRCPKSAT